MSNHKNKSYGKYDVDDKDVPFKKMTLGILSG